MYTQGTLRRFLELFLCIAPSPSYSSLNSSTLCPPKLPSFSLQLTLHDYPTLYGTLLPVLRSGKRLQEETHAGHGLRCASLSRNLDHSFALPVVQCLKTSISCILSNFLVAYSKKASPVTPG